MDSMMLIRAVVGLVIIAVAGFLALKRAWFLQGLIRTGQPAVGRTDEVAPACRSRRPRCSGRRSCCSGRVPGIAHVFALWGFIILTLTIIEAFGAAVHRQDFAFPVHRPLGRGRLHRGPLRRSWCSSAS